MGDGEGSGGEGVEGMGTPRDFRGHDVIVGLIKQLRYNLLLLRRFFCCLFRTRLSQKASAVSELTPPPPHLHFRRLFSGAQRAVVSFSVT